MRRSLAYYLRVEPESEYYRGTIYYSITLERDVPQFGFFGIAALALLIPAGVITWKFMNFEHLRWAESDYGNSDGSDDNHGAGNAAAIAGGIGAVAGLIGNALDIDE